MASTTGFTSFFFIPERATTKSKSSFFFNSLLTTTGESFSTTEGAAISVLGAVDVSTLLTGSATGPLDFGFGAMVLGSDFDEVGMGIPALLLDFELFSFIPTADGLENPVRLDDNYI
ncbi:hypothetical protein [uncultured Sulfitobacter sp.]|uniref:hypothetical protein n=1 Tax=uncultured Sulfitobacter sp. TaxID=191468 RepID=UPI00260F0B11|nr:hypothetical protein [uncultured Sulfitobacter sp.]